ncbi:MAG: serine hydrolase [Candidatus Pacebacteria bacterium]|nr:serine hydrolase [Candidatus Paceibacterota bacterium]MBP9866720.1 serine hydrolase [Candidatus Paceibacterota bacterium]
MQKEVHTTTLLSVIKYKYAPFFIIVLSGIIFGAGYITSSLITEDKYQDFLSNFKNIREDTSKYTFINPLVGNISAPATDVGIYTDIKEDIDSYLEKQKKKGELFNYSFYFRDLNSGLWFGSNELESFFPASLFKLPIALAAYKQTEDKPGFINTMVVYTEDIAKRNEVVQINAVSTLTIGKAYSIEYLIERMLIDSDNGAKDLILSVLDMKYFDDLFQTVSFVDYNTDNKYSLSSCKYSLFLRVLYGSSYVNETHSELIMSLLTKSEYKDGLVGGIPGSVKVAHKFGTYQFDEEEKGVTVSSRQLHDCGVVYHLENPYVICFMTKGKDLETLQKIIGHISSLVYQYQSEGDH